MVAAATATRLSSTPPSRIASVSENSKSFRSPSTITFAFASSARMLSTKSFTTCACWCRCVSVTRLGGWKRPNSGSSPPFELKWLAIANERLAAVEQELARQRLAAVVEGGVGRVDAAGAEASAAGRPGRRRRSVAAVEVPPGRSTNDRPRSVRKRKPTRMLPPGSPPSCVVHRVDLPELVGRAAGGGDRRDQRRPASASRRPSSRRWSGRCCPGSPRARRCRATCRLSTMRSASAANFAAASLGVEVLDVEGRDGELVGADGPRRPPARGPPETVRERLR